MYPTYYHRFQFPFSMNDVFGAVQERYYYMAKCRKQIQDLFSVERRVVIDNCDESLRPHPFTSFLDNSDHAYASIF